MKNKKLKIKQEKGITLIALVVTIVVLLILAGVSISLVLNNNGVISKAKDAKNQYAEAQTNDEKQLNEVSDWIDTKVGDTTGGGSVTKIDGVPIPAGFVYVGGTKASGLVISDAAADKEKYKGQTTVGTDLQGNQFVWIPVENIADYKRSAYGDNVDTGTIDSSTNSTQIKPRRSSSEYHTEAMPSDEKTSIETNKGYYIGRYEAGDKESTDANKFRISGASTSNTITIKAKQAPYNYIKYTDAKALAEGFKTQQNYSSSVTTKLVSSYAWDTAIAFIQKTNSDYGNSSEEGNYRDTTFTYTDIKGTDQIKEKEENGQGRLIPTGQTTAVNNIYDMGGNVWEWTTEPFSNTNYPYTRRGGGCDDGFAYCPAGYRNGFSDRVFSDNGFRLTLFL